MFLNALIISHIWSYLLRIGSVSNFNFSSKRFAGIENILEIEKKKLQTVYIGS
jgi:hypothetical protein